MKLLDLTLPTAAENLALDEALLDDAELRGAELRGAELRGAELRGAELRGAESRGAESRGAESRGAESRERPIELLRLWEPADPFVVIGRSSRVAAEVNQVVCRDFQVPVLRRCSGGAAVIAGPGCLMYAVVLSYHRRPELRALEKAHCFVLSVLARALSGLAPGVKIMGDSDLTRDDRKFSGNSLRCKRDHFLYHGTILYQFPLEIISRFLATPPRQPEYRRGREHGLFVDNFPADVLQLRGAIREAWGVTKVIKDWPAERVCRLVKERYSQASWNERM